MNTSLGVVPSALAHPSGCRLVIRRENSLAEILQFVAAGLEIGPQGVALAGPKCLKELASGLSAKGLPPETLLSNGRLGFLTPPGCLLQLTKPGNPMRRGPPPPNASLI